MIRSAGMDIKREVRFDDNAVKMLVMQGGRSSGIQMQMKCQWFEGTDRGQAGQVEFEDSRVMGRM